MKKKILIVTDRPRFSRSLVRYCLRLSRRMGYDVAALFVDGRGESGFLARIFGGVFGFAARARRAASALSGAFAGRGVAFEHTVAEGILAEAAQDFLHRAKRVEFALIEVDRGHDAKVPELTVPVHCFDRAQSFVLPRPVLPGVLRKMRNTRRPVMSAHSHSSKMSHLGKAAAALAASACIYAAVFANESAVTTLFTRGGLYAALPIAAAFAFSFVYGAFAHSFWSMLGIEAQHKSRVTPTMKAPAPRKDVRPRPTLNA